ncbi:MAG: hypothetical protein GXZ11_01355 [Tissierellia bacterium]|nr:hypothetical protein [Tissierellia bacterium]
MITYEGVCEKLGFDPLEYAEEEYRKYKKNPDVIDDSTWLLDKLFLLTDEEGEFLLEYVKDKEPLYT